MKTGAALRLIWKKSTWKALRKMQPKKAAAIREAMQDKAADPHAPDNNVKALDGVENGFRKRFGDWRVSYILDEEAGTLEVFEVKARGDAYRW